MKNKKKIILIALLILIVLIAIILFVLNLLSTNKEEAEQIISLVEKQSVLEDELDCTGYTIDNAKVVLNPYQISPLTALIMFETDVEVAPTVTIVGKDENTTFTHEFEESKSHYLSIYGLYPDSENEVIVSFLDTEKTFTIKTEALPDDFILPTSVKGNKDSLGNELYFFSPSSSGYTSAYDVNGDVRWYLTINALWEINRLSNGHLMVSTERRVNSPYYMSGLYEMDLLGKIYKEISLEGGYHHDYFEMPNGNLLVASDEFNNDYGTVEDVIVEVDISSGDIIKTWDLKDILNMEDGKSENWVDYDWFHNNSVWYDDATDSITLSGRHQDAVINIDYDTGSLNWIIGDSTNWSEEYQKYFFTPVGDDFEWQWSQHAAMITPEGYVFILDNGNNKSKIKEEYVPAEESYTRGVMYKIDTDKMTIEQIWEYGKERGSEFYSPYISDVDYLAKDHYIVHSGGIVYVDGKNSNQPAGLGGADKLVSDTVEILNDEVIFEIILPNNNYRVEKMSLYADNEKYEQTEAKRIGSLGKTELRDTKIGFVLGAKDISEFGRDFAVTQEIDRLVVSGRFKKGEDVNIILYQNGKSNIYHVSVSKKPYTALCLDIFTEDETENGIVIDKYINAEGLSGKYSVYSEVNDVIYDTNEYVEF